MVIRLTAFIIWKNLVLIKIIGKYKKSELNRILLRNSVMSLEGEHENKKIFYEKLEIQNINEEAFLLFTDIKIFGDEFLIKWKIDLPKLSVTKKS